MAKRSVCLLVTAPARSGKTYRRCAHFLTQEFLPLEKGRHISNFPINMDALCEYMEKHKGMSAEEVRERVEVIPEDVLAQWRKGTATPKDYFKGRDIDQCHIAIDEVHKYCGRLHKSKVRSAWMDWLGELGHSGATFEAISQAPEKIAKELENEAEKRIFLTNLGEQRDPFIGVRRADWLELKAKMTGGKVEHLIAEEERRREGGKWKVVERLVMKLDPELFRVYDSFSAPDNGGKKAKGFATDADRQSVFGLVRFIWKRNIERILPRILLAVVALWLFVGGGLGWVMKGAINMVVGAATKGALASQVQSEASGKAAAALVPGAIRPATQPATQPTTQPTTRPAEVVALEQEVAVLSAALRQAENDRRRVVDRLSEVVALGPEFCVMASGEVAYLGDVIGEGSYAGATVESVDMRRGVVRLSGAHVARLRRSGAAGIVGPSLAAGGGGSQPAGPTGRPTGRDRADGDNVGERTNGSGLRPFAQRPDGYERGGSAGPGTQGSGGGVRGGSGAGRVGVRVSSAGMPGGSLGSRGVSGGTPAGRSGGTGSAGGQVEGGGTADSGQEQSE